MVPKEKGEINMDEYTRLYGIYLKKSNLELQEIMNPQNGYTEAAIKAATTIFQERGPEYQYASKEESENIVSFSTATQSKKKKTPIWFPIAAILFSFIIGAVLISTALNLSHTRNSGEDLTAKAKEVETLQKELDYMQEQYNAKVKELDAAQKTIADLQKLLDDKQTQQNQNESVQPPQSSTDSLTVPDPTNTNYESSI